MSYGKSGKGKSGKDKGGSSGGVGGVAASYGAGADTAAWDEAQKRGLAAPRASSAASLQELLQARPQQQVEAFPHLTVAADWPERRQPRSGSAFYLPLIWSALVLEDAEGSTDTPAASRGRAAALAQLASLGDERHFHGGGARRCTVAELRVAQDYWRQILSGWASWVQRLRASMDVAPGGRAGVVASYVQKLSVTACAIVYGDLGALGALPHISNARGTPHQDAILELDFMVRCELEASVATMYLTGGVVTPAAPANADAAPAASACASGAALVAPVGAAEDIGAADRGERVADANGETMKEVMRVKKKLREIEELRRRSEDQLDTLQLKKVAGEAELLARLKELGASA